MKLRNKKTGEIKEFALFDDDPNNIVELEKKLAEYPYQFKALCVGTGRLEEMENVEKTTK